MRLSPASLLLPLLALGLPGLRAQQPAAVTVAAVPVTRCVKVVASVQVTAVWPSLPCTCIVWSVMSAIRPLTPG